MIWRSYKPPAVEVLSWMYKGKGLYLIHITYINIICISMVLVLKFRPPLHYQSHLLFKCKSLQEGTWLTMCDFHNFGLIFAGQMHCLPQRLKSTLFENFSNGGCPKGTRSVEKISNNVDFSLWGKQCNHMGIFFDIFKWDQIKKITHNAELWRSNHDLIEC